MQNIICVRVSIAMVDVRARVHTHVMCKAQQMLYKQARSSAAHHLKNRHLAHPFRDCSCSLQLCRQLRQQPRLHSKPPSTSRYALANQPNKNVSHRSSRTRSVARLHRQLNPSQQRRL